MPQTGSKTTVNEDGVEKDAYTVTFTNGALQELEDLKTKMGAPSLDSVVQIAIGVLRRLEEHNGTKPKPE
jgi:hypothetical protein